VDDLGIDPPRNGVDDLVGRLWIDRLYVLLAEQHSGSLSYQLALTRTTRRSDL
jgi:hypothetical protein